MDMPIPPADLRFMGGDDAKFLKDADDLAEVVLPYVPPDGRLLDVGAGYGRLLFGLRRAGWAGEYTGIDVLKKYVTWCRENLSDERTQFLHLDVVNDRYNRAGAVQPSAVDFPKADTAVLLSVFTHMWPADIAAYLTGLRRALPTGGHVCASVFLNSRRMRRQRLLRKVTYRAAHRVDNAVVMNPEEPLHVIAVDERWYRDRVRDAGFEIVDLSYGWWVGGDGPIFQDWTVLRAV